MRRRLDLTGDNYGSLYVVAKCDGKNRKWLCRCECGNTVEVDQSHLRTGHTRSCGCGAARVSVVSRFMDKIQFTESGCIEWVGGLNGLGYGQFYRGKRSADDTGKVYAHRWSYEFFVGPIPKGLHLDHLCRNTRCVNPQHLEPVTPREKNLRGISPAAEHSVKTECPKGHEYFGANLYVHPTKRYRVCRTCGRDRARARRIAAKEQRIAQQPRRAS